EPPALPGGAGTLLCGGSSARRGLQARNAHGGDFRRYRVAEGLGSNAGGMKFALVLTNLAGGGAERGMLRLAQALQRRGHQALLVLLERRIEHVIPAGLALHVVGSARKGTFGAWLAAFRI